MNLEQLFLIDIETVSEYEYFEQLPELGKKLWTRKAQKQFVNEQTTVPESYPQRAAIFAEFGKIICIGTAFFIYDNDGNLQLKQKTIYNTDETELLLAFLDICQKFIAVRKDIHFVGHNIKEFDIPYICRRLLINNLELPKYLDFQNLKPWETNLIDTLHWWRFGDFKNYTSLETLAYCFNIPTSKDGIDGSMVGTVYYKEKDLVRIADYCSKDVLLVAQIVLRYLHMPLLADNRIINNA